ncbi:MAG: hydrogenase maturation nickel metallochaperone HypA [Deltaproteobacteria bacterium]|nr:hydrogenase maturation nickel metallochaperone HypA [Deltaproteobacteria bacterium]
MEIGKIPGVEIEAIRFALEVICKNTFSTSVKVTIDEISALARCRVCQKEYNLENLCSLCPYCSAYDREILKVKELWVKAVTIE